MALHLIKLCVGIAAPDELRAWRAEQAALGQTPIVHTRQTPQRAEEILDGGSLYWVIKGLIRLRQPVTAIETVGEGVQKRCEIHLGAAMIDTEPFPRRAFQGWRYLEPKAAPQDLGLGASGQALPSELIEQLRALGAW